MADKEYWVGSVGPLYYDDADTYPDAVVMEGGRWPQIYLDEAPAVANNAVRKTDLEGYAAPIGAQYLVLALDATLTNERVFTLGNGLDAVDSGAGAAYTVSVDETELDHGAIGGLGDDDHSNYLYLPGRGGQRVEDTIEIRNDNSTAIPTTAAIVSGNTLQLTNTDSSAVYSGVAFAARETNPARALLGLEYIAANIGELFLRFRTGGATSAETMRLKYDQAQFGTPGTNYTKIEQDGTIEFNGDATVWNDLQFPIATGKVPAANAPTWGTFTTNTKEYYFIVDDYIDLQAGEAPHSWLEGGTAHFHIHATIKTLQNSGGNQYAKFTAYVAYAKANVWTEHAALTAEKTIANGTAAMTDFYLDLGDVDLSGYTIGTQIKVRIKRIAATSGDEYGTGLANGDIFITQVGAHMIDSTCGSRSEASK